MSKAANNYEVSNQRRKNYWESPEYRNHIYADVFNISLILETILNKINTQQLLKLRLTNFQFQKSTSHVLRQRKHSHLLFQDFSCEEKCKKKTLSDFNNLLKFSAIHGTDIPFDCFTFITGASCAFPNSIESFFLNKELLNFLSVHGNKIHFLRLMFDETNEEYLPEENDALKEIMKLLQDTPNLSYLAIYLNTKSEAKKNLQEEKNENICIQPVLKKLKVLESIKNTSINIIEKITCASSNLDEVILNSGEKQNFFYREEKRQGYLKTLLFTPSSGHIDLLEKIGCSIQNKHIILKTFYINLVNLRKLEAKDCEDTYFRRIMKLVSSILQNSCDSLNEIYWKGIAPFSGLEFPKVFPNLSFISFGKKLPQWQQNHNQDQDQDQNQNQNQKVTFPAQEELRIASSMPRLSTVQLTNFESIKDFEYFANILTPENLRFVKECLIVGPGGVYPAKEYFEVGSKFFVNAKIIPLVSSMGFC